jgi:molybdopterin-guanine dinucleotide biosynthesis protein A
MASSADAARSGPQAAAPDTPDAAWPPSIPRTDITGIILAGGLGRRMSADGLGLDKGLQRFRGRPMAAHAIERLLPQVGQVAINANRNADQWAALGLPVFCDRIPDFAGPLAGLHAAMAFATTPWLMTVPCDSPFLPCDLVIRLARAAADNTAQVAVARTGNQPHPVFALVKRSLEPDLAAFLASGRRRIDAWYAPLRVAEVDFADEHAFVNLNTADELRQFDTGGAE